MTQNQNTISEPVQTETHQTTLVNENTSQQQKTQPIREFFGIDADEFENRKLCIAKGCWLS